MFCQECGARISDGARFCSSCGAQQGAAVPSVITELTCPYCGEKLDSDSVFCDNCGRKITGVIPAPVAAPQAPIAVPQLPAATPQAPRSKKAGIIVLIIAVVVLSFLLVSAIGIIIWIRLRNKPEDIKEKRTETKVTETDDFWETRPTSATKVTETRADRETETYVEISEVPTAEDTASALKHDPSGFQTSDMSKMGDFQWITYDIMYGYVPENVELLTDPQEIAGGWKAYIVDDYRGEDSVYIERLCNVDMNVSGQSVEVSIKWDYLYNGSTDESYSEKDYPDSVFVGKWSNGGISATGAGGIYITGFWYKDGKEYAVGAMTWADGMTSTVFLVRP